MKKIKWKPIEDLPKEERDFVLRDKDGHLAVGLWNIHEQQIVYDHDCWRCGTTVLFTPIEFFDFEGIE